MRKTNAAETKEAFGVVGEAFANMQELFNKPLAGDAVFRPFVEEDAIAASTAAAEEMAKIKAAAAANADPGGGGSSVGLSDSEKKSLEDRIETLRDSWATEQELILEKYETDQAMLDEALENKLISEQQHREDLYNLALRYNEDVNKLEQNAAKARERIKQQEEQAKQNLIAQGWSKATALINSESRKMFEIGKAAAIANSIINTYQSVMNAMGTLPPPVNFAVAAASLAFGLLQVQNIRKQSFQGGGGAAATGSNSTAVNAANTPVGAGGAAAPSQTMFIQGINPSSLYSGDQVKQLGQSLYDWSKDGGNVVFAQ
jgi:hypothetical protein